MYNGDGDHASVKTGSKQKRRVIRKAFSNEEVLYVELLISEIVYQR